MPFAVPPFMTTHRKHESSWLWLALLPMTAGWTLLAGLNPLQHLCAIAGSIFLIVKFASERHYLATAAMRPSRCDRLAWFLLWPGLDPQAFFTHRRDVETPAPSEWACGVLKMAFGLLLLRVVAPRCLTVHELAAGWVAMIGLVFTLHFGLFHLAALGWRRAGRDVVPIMLAPIMATSLNEFWSRRWNLAFRDFAYTFVFRPLVRQRQARLAEWLVFAFSGLVHELAISVPAGAGFGLPLAYFLLQGFGVWIERRLPGAGVTRSRLFGWLFTALLAAPAAYWLFHPAFVRRLILPLIGG